MYPVLLNMELLRPIYHDWYHDDTAEAEIAFCFRFHGTRGPNQQARCAHVSTVCSVSAVVEEDKHFASNERYRITGETVSYPVE